MHVAHLQCVHAVLRDEGWPLTCLLVDVEHCCDHFVVKVLEAKSVLFVHLEQVGNVVVLRIVHVWDGIEDRLFDDRGH